MNLFQKAKNFIKFRTDQGKDETQRIISFWEKGGYDFEYFEKAESQDWLSVFWSSNTAFRNFFDQLDLKQVLEIACGAGRHSGQVIDRIGELYLLDSSEGALKLARERFKDLAKVSYIHNPDGNGVPSGIIPENSLTAIFSYDAMVHFEPACVEAYVADGFKYLRPGGLALFHHSNFDKNPDGKFTENPGWRNYMNLEMFRKISMDAGFSVLGSVPISFPCPESDGLTLLRKPGPEES